MISIREAVESDAEALFQLRKSLFDETDFMLLEAEEYDPTVEKEAGFIRMFGESENSLILLAIEDDSKLVGFMGVAGGTVNRTKHKANVFLGVLKDYWGKGIGKSMFHKLLPWAQEKELLRLELTTAVDNERAFTLYKNMGFEVEGIMRKCLLVNSMPVDEYQMSYLVPSKSSSVSNGY